MKKSQCYCCPKPSSSKAMDVDSALHELGMLSSSTVSRKQFMCERSRTKSESATQSVAKKCVTGSVTNIANGYQILQINPTFVTGFVSQFVTTTESASTSSPSPSSSSLRGANSSYIPCVFAGSYRQGSLEADVKMHRLARIKLGRQRRFRKPYEVPWRLHHSLPLPEIKPDSPCDKRPPDCSDLNIETTTTTLTPVTNTPSKSNSSSPIKIPSLVIHRSKSLDDLDLARLKISELSHDQNNFLTQRQEIDQMSQNLKDLQMKE